MVAWGLTKVGLTKVGRDDIPRGMKGVGSKISGRTFVGYDLQELTVESVVTPDGAPGSVFRQCRVRTLRTHNVMLARTSFTECQVDVVKAAGALVAYDCSFDRVSLKGKVSKLLLDCSPGFRPDYGPVEYALDIEHMIPVGEVSILGVPGDKVRFRAGTAIRVDLDLLRPRWPELCSILDNYPCAYLESALRGPWSSVVVPLPTGRGHDQLHAAGRVLQTMGLATPGG